MEKITQFFLFCSGIHHPLLKLCPTERNKYVGIGASILFTGIFATIAAIFTLNTIFSTIYLPVIIGLIWGLMIFNLDRYIVSSIRKYDSLKLNLWSILPRFILATMLSIVIAKPLELKVFEKEIEDELQLMHRQKSIEQIDSISKQLQTELLQIEEQQTKLNKGLEKRLIRRDELTNQLQSEADGTGGSGQRNLGPIFRVKEQSLIEFNKELEGFKQMHDIKSNRLLKSSDSIRKSAENAIKEIHKPKADGLASRLEALDRLSNRYSSIWWAVLFITLLFIVVETTPILLKSLTPKGPYDYLIEQEEALFNGHKKSP